MSNEMDVLRKFFNLFNNEEIEIIRKKVLACEGKPSKREASYNESSENVIDYFVRLNKSKKHYSSYGPMGSYETLF